MRGLRKRALLEDGESAPRKRQTDGPHIFGMVFEKVHGLRSRVRSHRKYGWRGKRRVCVDIGTVINVAQIVLFCERSS